MIFQCKRERYVVACVGVKLGREMRDDCGRIMCEHSRCSLFQKRVVRRFHEQYGKGDVFSSLRDH